jgi:peptidoglycan hydrolase CwlO-like protein
MAFQIRTEAQKRDDEITHLGHSVTRNGRLLDQIKADMRQMKDDIEQIKADLERLRKACYKLSRGGQVPSRSFAGRASFWGGMYV